LPILNTIGDHIKRRRLELGLLQREAAAQIGVTVDTILNWEHNRTGPKLQFTRKVIAFLGYNPFHTGFVRLGEKALQYRNSQGTC